MKWMIAPVEGGWFLFYEGTKPGVWWHVYTNKWYAIFPTLDDVISKMQERIRRDEK